MINLTLAFVTSLLLGMRHATDPDHVVAISTIVSRERSLARATGIGVAWGIGHTMTILIVGLAMIAFKVAFTPVIGLSLEMSVAVMLVLLGAANLFGPAKTAAPVPVGHVRPFAVGVVHGLAGSAAATLLIVPLIPDARWAVIYLVVFGAGTVVGMAMITLAIAAPAVLAAARIHSLQRTIRLAAGALSVGFGLYLTWKIGINDGLMTGHAQWTPW